MRLFFSFSALFCNSEQIEQEPVTLNVSSDIVEQQDTIQKEKVQNSWDKIGALYLPSILYVSGKNKSLSLLDNINNSSINEYSTKNKQK